MTAPDADDARAPAADAPAHASAAHAARLIGRSERAVQGWMRDAGHAAALVPGAGYPTALLCAVVNRHAWPGQFALTPAHFAVDAAPAADAGESGPPGARADAAALAVISRLERALADGAAREEQMARQIADLDAKVGRLAEYAAASDEAREKAAQTTQDALLRQEAALGRIESAQRRAPWWRRLFGG